MIHSHISAFHTVALAVVLNIALGLSGTSFVNEVSTEFVSNFSAKMLASFGVTQEVDSNTRMESLSGTYRAEAIPKKNVVDNNKRASKDRNIKISNVFANYSQTFQIFSQGL